MLLRRRFACACGHGRRWSRSPTRSRCPPGVTTRLRRLVLEAVVSAGRVVGVVAATRDACLRRPDEASRVKDIAFGGDGLESHANERFGRHFRYEPVPEVERPAPLQGDWRGL